MNVKYTAHVTYNLSSNQLTAGRVYEMSNGSVVLAITHGPNRVTGVVRLEDGRAWTGDNFRNSKYKYLPKATVVIED